MRYKHMLRVCPLNCASLFLVGAFIFLVPFRSAVLNFPADYSLPEPQPGPERDRSHEMEQPSPLLCTHVVWHKSRGYWCLRSKFLTRLKAYGIHIPTSYLFQSEAIRALQTCAPCHLLHVCFAISFRAS